MPLTTNAVITQTQTIDFTPFMLWVTLSPNPFFFKKKKIENFIKMQSYMDTGYHYILIA
jgi:hypothetical protein